MAFIGTLQKRTLMDDFLSGMGPGLTLAGQLSTERQRGEEKQRLITQQEEEKEKERLMIIMAGYQTANEKKRREMESSPEWPEFQAAMAKYGLSTMIPGGKMITPAPTMEQLKAQTFQTLTLDQQQRKVTGEKPTPFEPKKESYAFAFKRVQDAIAMGRQPNPTWLKLIEAYIKPEAGTQLTGKDKVVQDTWELIKEDLYSGRQPEPWQWKIVGGYVAAEKEGRLDPMEQAYQEVYGKYKEQGIESLDEIERNILKYHPVEPGPKDAIIKQIWAKYQRGESLTPIEEAILAGIKPKEEQRIPVKERAFETVWQKYLGGGVLTDIDRGIIGAELEKKTTPLSPKEQAFKESWGKYTRLGEENLTDVDKAQLGITPPPKKEESIQDQAYRKAYERLKGNLRLTEFDRAILGIPLKKPKELEGKELILDVISRKYLTNETLTSEEWDLLGVTPKAEPTGKEQVVEWAFTRVKEAIGAGRDPDPSDLKIIGGYVSAAPEQNITAKIKAWAFDEIVAGRGKPEHWKVIGGYVEPAAAVKSELKTINGDLWLINAVTGEKRRILKGQVDKQKLISEAFKEALAYAKGKWPGYWERALDEEEQLRWDKDFRLQWHKSLMTRGLTAAQSRLIIKPSPLATGQKTMYAPPEKPTLTPDQRKIYNMALNQAKGKQEKIKLMQQNLAKWGLYTGTIDGVIGSDTREALYNAVQRGLVKERGK